MSSTVAKKDRNLEDVQGSFKEQTKAAAPWLAAKNRLPYGYSIDESGVTVNPKGDQDKGELICGPLWICAETADENSESWGVVLKWIDMDNKEHERAIQRGRFHESSGAYTLSQELANSGLFIKPSKEKAVTQYLASFQKVDKWRSAEKVGWLDSKDGALTYVLPQNTLQKSGNTRVVFQPERHSPSSHTMHSCGTLEEWKEAVVKPVAEEEYFLFCLCVAFAGPLLRFAEIESGGFHLYQQTSRGKTTAAQVAASVWGCSADPSHSPDNSFLNTWNTTSNALAGLAAAHNDNLLVLDEIGKGSTREFGKSIYNLMGGQDKSRLDSNSNLRKRRTWRLMVLSTGEDSVQQTIEKTETAKGGQLVRFCDIHIEGSLILHAPSPGLFADNIKKHCATTYGIAGPAFIQAIVERYTAHQLKEKITMMSHEAHARLIPYNASNEISRLGKRFALVEVAGKLACECLGLPVDDKQIEASMDVVCGSWLKGASSVRDDDRWIDNIREFIAANPGRFVDTDDENPIGRDIGYIKKTGQERQYLFRGPLLCEAARANDASKVAKALCDRGFLFKNNNQWTSRFNVKSLPGRSPFYAIRGEILQDGDCDDVTD